MSLLFTPLTIKGITFKNRIVVSPMCQYSSEDGCANDWHLVHLGSRAVGGAALIIQEATAVSPEGRITPEDMGIWKDEHIEKLKTITSFIDKHASIPGIQLAHAGRKASHASPWKGGKQLKLSEGGWETVAPSTIAFKEDEEPPVALDQKGIQKVINDFVAATKRSSLPDTKYWKSMQLMVILSMNFCLLLAITVRMNMVAHLTIGYGFYCKY